jgi:hypothetical protein
VKPDVGWDRMSSADEEHDAEPEGGYTGEPLAEAQEGPTSPEVGDVPPGDGDTQRPG